MIKSYPFNHSYGCKFEYRSNHDIGYHQENQYFGHCYPCVRTDCMIHQSNRYEWH